MQKLILRHGDCVDVLKDYEDGSIGAFVCDPPYDLTAVSRGGSARQAGTGPFGRHELDTVAVRGGFMGKTWDGTGIAFSPLFWDEAHRVLCPGGVVKAFSGTRTFHRMAAAMQDAGFRDLRLEVWSYGSGFPKSLNIGKALDKAAGSNGRSTVELKREVRGLLEARGLTLTQFNEACGFEASGYLRETSTWAAVLPPEEKWALMRRVLNADARLDEVFKAAQREVVGQSRSGLHRGSGTTVSFGEGVDQGPVDLTAPATEAAQLWEGWGTALKPSWEPVVVGRKPQ
jgi:hypothetical protein